MAGATDPSRMPLPLLFALPLAHPLPLALSERPAAISYLPAPPAPLDEPDTLARRSFELWAGLGLGLPHCAVSSGDGCAALRPGAEFSLLGLMRPAPWFAFGLSARYATFSVTPTGDDWQSAASASFVGAAARVYAFESGRFDPYLELNLGAGALSLDVHAGNAGRREHVTLAPALRSALGFDLLLNSWLRCGAYLSYSRYLPGSVSRCGALGCTAVAAGDSTLTLGSTALGVSLGWTAGELL